MRRCPHKPRGPQDLNRENGSGANFGFEEKLWLSADKLRGNRIALVNAKHPEQTLDVTSAEGATR